MNINTFDTLQDTIHSYLAQFRQQFDLVTKRLKTAPDGSIKILRKGRRILSARGRSGTCCGAGGTRPFIRRRGRGRAVL